MYFKNRFRLGLVLISSMMALSCNNIIMDLPDGPKGDTGKSTYEIWKDEVEAGKVDWPTDRTEVADFLVYIKGEKGDKGESAYSLWKDMITDGNVPNPHVPGENWDSTKNSQADFWNYLTGRDGKTPHIGENGNWWIGSTDTGIRAEAIDGKDGKDGIDGKDGVSAYEQWSELVNEGKIDWPSDKTTVSDFYSYLKGKDGKNGLTPHVGTNGNWWIGGADSGIPATGAKGDKGDTGADGITPTEGQGNTWVIGNVDTGIPVRGEKGEPGLNGKDGDTPEIGANGNWFIGGKDTGVSARGEKGDSGLDGVAGNSPYIGANGNWFIDGVDTTIPATGAKGDKGDKGDAGQNGNTPYIQNGTWWIGTEDTGVPATGEKGDTGASGDAGTDGTDGATPEIGANGNWIIGGIDTGIPARGEKGDNGADGADGQNGADGANGVDGKDGADGISPHIGANGNWFIGDEDTGIPATGANGAAGLSAYELWAKDLNDGKITNKDGSEWPSTENTMADFYRYLTGANGVDGKDGADGKDGLSAYELWKQTAEEGNLPDPKNPGETWPSDSVSVRNFFYYLTGADGTDGINGANGLSAYELWKNELAAKAGTDEALLDYRNGGVWNPNKNSLDDFFQYLRGADGDDGKNGADGKPGEPGKPGAEVEIQLGVPNVIAQYSQAEYGEYVRTDGSVMYMVYGKDGKPAAGAVVNGLPGIAQDKTYTSDANGAFYIPKEDLPEIQDVNRRWGTTMSVTINGEELESARNTYVPNRAHVRFNVRSCSLDYQLNTYGDLQRKMNPEDDWANVPSYLPNLSTIAYKKMLVSDKYDPSSTVRELKPINSKVTSSGTINCYTNRFMVANPINEMNGADQYWEEDAYITIVAAVPYYGEIAKWNGTAELPRYQLAPTIKFIQLNGRNDSTEPFFDSAEGEFDYSDIDISHIYKSSASASAFTSGLKQFTFNCYSESEFKDYAQLYISFGFRSGNGDQTAKSDNNKSSVNKPAFKVLTPYLGSAISLTIPSSVFKTYTCGQLVEDEENGGYCLTKAAQGLPTVPITYVD